MLKTGKKQSFFFKQTEKVQSVGFANQRRDVLIGDDAELVNSAIEHIKSTVLQPKTKNYGMPARFQQVIGGTDNPPTELMGVVRSSAAGS